MKVRLTKVGEFACLSAPLVGEVRISSWGGFRGYCDGGVNILSQKSIAYLEILWECQLISITF